VAQYFRRAGTPVVHISQNIDYVLPNSRQRRAGSSAVRRGNLTALEEFNARAIAYHHLYIPGFRDECVYHDLTRFGKYRDNRLSLGVAVARNDYIISNFKEAAMSFVGLGKKTVIVLGQHTNMCLMAVFQYCKEVGLDLVIVRDLVDTAWLYEFQKDHHPTHDKGNDATNRYFDSDFGCSIRSYDLIRALRNVTKFPRDVEYAMFTKSSHVFEYFE